MPSCDSNTIAAFIEGALSAEEEARFEAHVDTCPECRALLGMLGRSAVALRDGQPDPEASPPIRIGERVGRYVILDWLGEGGMGVVYAAHDPELDRTIALKFLRPGLLDTRSAGGERLLGEARAMAKVAHPNVVNVFDAGVHGERIFVVMERVDGSTLREWLAAAPRAPRDVLHMFVEAGRGVAAAHAAGLVHRDFKPDNVLVGADGRVRVTDFGLALARAANVERLGPTDDARGPGTPAYMAPEHGDPDRIDARTDQFSFCVALYEALHGAPPFPRKAAPEKYARTPDPPRGVPRRVARAIVRGLRANKEERHPSMTALLDELAPPRWPLRVVLALGILVLAIAGGASFAMHRLAARPAVCPSAEPKLAGVWDGPSRERVHKAFLATGQPYAEDTWKKTERILDTYVSRWTAMNVEACEATQIRAEQSPQLMDLRIDCLAGELREMKALISVYADADAKTLQESVKSARALRSVDACSDVRSLVTKLAPPSDPAQRARIDEVLERVGQAAALESAAKYVRAAEVAQAAATDAATLGYPPALAEALRRRANIAWRRGDDAAAVLDLFSTIEAAEMGRDDLLKARALTTLVYVLGDRQQRYADAERIAQLARGAIERSGGHGELEARLLEGLAAIHQGQGRYDEARKLGVEALALWEKANGPDDLEVAISLNNLSLALRRLGDLSGTLAKREQALGILQRVLGRGHPTTATIQGNVAVALTDMHRLDTAWAMAEESRDLLAQTLGPDHVQVAYIEDTLAAIRLEQDRCAEALPHAQRATDIIERTRGPKSPTLAEVLNTVGRIERCLGRVERAIELHRRALSIWEPASTESGGYATTLHAMGEDWLAAKRPSSALAPLERALQLRSGPDRLQEDLADTRFTLARALDGARREPDRARSLADAALDFYAATPGCERDRDTVAMFLRTLR
ncbi:tetratricopeptide repeat protein [Pendulispora albinea]|uniref:Tetratricopeptide repeat protein n=1 Tax=Pendulispora albinea TaxID=2741071 RepID=A0ABZ2M1L3_9BACT